MALKFRGYDRKYKSMDDVFQLDWWNDDLRVNDDTFSDYVVMQSTGLHDNTKFEDLSDEEQEEWLESGKTDEEWQGREIFQGDIVKPERASSFVVGKFIFGEGIFKIAIITKDGNGFEGIYDGSSVKVIGNVWENPELLEE